jgi:hypothetical protein
MPDKWEKTGSGENVVSMFVPGPDWVRVENTETGETGTVYVLDGQTVGEAIANGQWHEEPK